MKFDLKRLKGERVARGLTQAEMAHQIGISTNAYWRKENGERDICMGEFVKILKVLGFKKKQISLFFAKDIHNKER